MTGILICSKINGFKILLDEEKQANISCVNNIGTICIIMSVAGSNLQLHFRYSHNVFKT